VTGNSKTLQHARQWTFNDETRTRRHVDGVGPVGLTVVKFSPKKYVRFSHADVDVWLLSVSSE
jgi:hypothetical protein